MRSSANKMSNFYSYAFYFNTFSISFLMIPLYKINFFSFVNLHNVHNLEYFFRFSLNEGTFFAKAAA